MKIIVIGATGTIGKGIVSLLSPDHDIVKVGYNSGDATVNLGDSSSIISLFESVGNFNALVCAAGEAKFGGFEQLGEEDYLFGLKNKLMGQVNLVTIGSNYINDNGVFTLTSGMLSYHPSPESVSLTMVNRGVEGFVQAAALGMKRGVRINIVSPVFVKETMEKMGMDGSGGMPSKDVALAYKASIETDMNGEILDVKDFV